MTRDEALELIERMAFIPTIKAPSKKNTGGYLQGFGGVGRSCGMGESREVVLRPHAFRRPGSRRGRDGMRGVREEKTRGRVGKSPRTSPRCGRSVHYQVYSREHLASFPTNSLAFLPVWVYIPPSSLTHTYIPTDDCS